MKFYIETLGCKVNSYESDYIKKSLVNNGFLEVEDYTKASIIIVNTCTVTNESDHKSLKRVRKLKRECPDSIFVVCGCSVQNNKELYENLGIDILLGNVGKSKISNLLLEYLSNKKTYEYITKNRNLEFEDMEIDEFHHTRAFIKIQDGCDNFCSYCVIPFVRGKNRSKSHESIINEANALVKKGHIEIVLTGIDTGSYNNQGYDLVDLINELSNIEGLIRIRLSSVEITQLNDKFLKMLETNSKFCNHLHIPIQSGSDMILKKMNRKYDLEYFKNKINEIRKIRNDISITTDLIVGHPYETEELFNETINTIKEIRFSKVHVFPYSIRNGTVSSMMEEKVDESIKKDRVRQVIKLSNILEEEYYNRFIGKNVSVLIEEIKDNMGIGHTSNYLKVSVPNIDKKNIIVDYII